MSEDTSDTKLETEWDIYPHRYCSHGYYIGFGCPEHDQEIDPAELVGVIDEE